jgi:AraC-like DNA-binding protein
MRKQLQEPGDAGLEGLCQNDSLDGRAKRASIRIGRGSVGIERVEARLSGQAFSPHRHDTYALGITFSGIQTFRYRGAQRYCLPGQGHILHPDETHDGGSATGDSFGYRIIYIDPVLVQQALGGKPLPFVAEPVVQRRDMLSDLTAYLCDIDDPIGEIEALEIAVSIAATLEALAAPVSRRSAPLRIPSLLRVRELIAASPSVQLSIKDFERVTGLDRWSIARQFRAAFGTSPSRFRTMRQLDRARLLISRGQPLSEVALDVGFADQSHMSRMFKRTYGLTPGQWAAARNTATNSAVRKAE